MIPSEFLVVGAITLGITVPVTTVIDASHPEVNMTRYEMRKDCPVGDTVIDVCLFDTAAGTVIGAKP